MYQANSTSLYSYSRVGNTRNGSTFFLEPLCSYLILSWCWILFPLPAVEQTAILFLVALVAILVVCAPLLEEEWDVPTSASVTQSAEPFYRCATGARTALAACYHPVDAVEVYICHITKERFTRQEADGSINQCKKVNTFFVFSFFTRHTQPYVLRYFFFFSSYRSSQTFDMPALSIIGMCGVGNSR